jgi:hypothetical protein
MQSLNPGAFRLRSRGWRWKCCSGSRPAPPSPNNEQTIRYMLKSVCLRVPCLPLRPSSARWPGKQFFTLCAVKNAPVHTDTHSPFAAATRSVGLTAQSRCDVKYGHGFSVCRDMVFMLVSTVRARFRRRKARGQEKTEMGESSMCQKRKTFH